MELAALAFLRAVIRYFVPGLAFYVFAVCLPVLLVLGETDVANLQLFNPWEVLSAGVVLGYTLDAMGAYRWTLGYWGYRRTRDDLAARLRQSQVNPDARNDPDLFLAELWLRRPRLYDRAMQERADWVVALEIAASLLIGAAVLGIAIGIRWGQGMPWSPSIAVAALLECIGSWAASNKGTQRIWPYNNKIVLAAQSMRAASADGGEAEPPRHLRSKFLGWIRDRVRQ